MLLLALLALADARDPFAAPQPDYEAARAPLERFPVSDLVLEGAVSGTAAPRALLALPDGTVAVVRVGTRVGPLLGRVAAIRADKVLVVEASRDPITFRRIERTTEVTSRALTSRTHP